MEHEQPLPQHIGETITVTSANGNTGTVKKKGAGDYVFFIATIHERMRWGNSAEIRRDIAYFKEYNTLPPPEKVRWGMG